MPEMNGRRMPPSVREGEAGELGAAVPPQKSRLPAQRRPKFFWSRRAVLRAEACAGVRRMEVRAEQRAALHAGPLSAKRATPGTDERRAGSRSRRGEHRRSIRGAVRQHGCGHDATARLRFNLTPVLVGAVVVLATLARAVAMI